LTLIKNRKNYSEDKISKNVNKLILNKKPDINNDKPSILPCVDDTERKPLDKVLKKTGIEEEKKEIYSETMGENLECILSKDVKDNKNSKTDTENYNKGAKRKKPTLNISEKPLKKQNIRFESLDSQEKSTMVNPIQKTTKLPNKNIVNTPSLIVNEGN